MKETVRTGVWETNSSSIHSLTLCSDDVYNKWKNGILLYSPGSQKFKSVAEVDKGLIYGSETDEDEDEEEEDMYELYYSYNDYWDNFIDHVYGLQEVFSEVGTIDGVKVRAFGYLGHD